MRRKSYKDADYNEADYNIMGRCLFPVIVQDQLSPNCRNGETGELTGVHVNGRKSETRGWKGK